LNNFSFLNGIFSVGEIFKEVDTNTHMLKKEEFHLSILVPRKLYGKQKFH